MDSPMKMFLLLQKSKIEFYSRTMKISWTIDNFHKP